MKREWTKIEFEKERPFSKRMGATLLFMRENMATILRLSASFLLPTALLFTLFFTWSTSHLFRYLTIGYITPSALGAFALLLASAILLILLVPSFSYSLLQLYNERDERLKGIHFGEVMSRLKSNFAKIACLLPYLIMLIFLFILLKIKVSSGIATITFIIFLLGIGAPLLLLMPIYTIEKIIIIQIFQTFFKFRIQALGFYSPLLVCIEIIRSMYTAIVCISVDNEHICRSSILCIQHYF
jgi:hypothetical protein